MQLVCCIPSARVAQGQNLMHEDKVDGRRAKWAAKEQKLTTEEQKLTDEEFNLTAEGPRSQFKKNYFTEMCSGSEASSYSRLIYFDITRF